MLHDLVIKTIASYLFGDIETLHNLQLLNQRFYRMRNVFYGYMCLSPNKSTYNYVYTPDGWDQVYQLVFHDFYPMTDLRGYHKIKGFIFKSCHRIHPLNNLQNVISLTFINCPLDTKALIDIASLSKLKYLELSLCPIEDLSPLSTSSIDQLFVSYLNIPTIPYIANLHEVDIESCPFFDDISNLTKVRVVSIHQCSSLTDVSCLGSGTIKDLIISACHKIKDITALKNMKKVKIICCKLLNQASRDLHSPPNFTISY